MLMLDRINGGALKLLISEEQIARRVRELGQEITGDYKGKDPLILGILKGGFIFLADLVRQIELDVEIDFLRVSSYRESDSPGRIELLQDSGTSLKGRDLILVEDLLDTGDTLGFIKEIVLAREPASFKICALIDKKERRKQDIIADYLGFEIERGFIVGYGTDYAEKGRNLPGIYVIDESD
jgi:hypoxanthine phosphoribosyltransferase